MHVYSNGPSENGIIGLEKGIRLGVNCALGRTLTGRERIPSVLNEMTVNNFYFYA